MFFLEFSDFRCYNVVVCDAKISYKYLQFQYVNPVARILN